MSTCPACQANCTEGDRFCADCGAKLPAPAIASRAAITACSCGSTEFDADGFCMECGVKARPRGAQAGATILGPGLAALTDAGLVHARNEDACVLAGPACGGHGTILVVCDGVSNSQAPDIAAAAAAHAALDTLQAALAAGEGPEPGIRAAIVRAHETVCAVPYDRQDPVDPPATTIAIAHVAAGEAGRMAVAIGWLGDSRVYWVARPAASAGSGGRLLTRDHSWRNLVVDRGEMTDEAARKDRLAHALVKCLGSTDFTAPTPCPEPTVVTIDLPREGWLLACTDGLWNYAETPSAMAAAARGAFWTTDAAGICARLIAFARERGGQDNITAAVAELV
jgi:serine/threonine protein phosphatase PrpC